MGFVKTPHLDGIKESVFFDPASNLSFESFSNSCISNVKRGSGIVLKVIFLNKGFSSLWEFCSFAMLTLLQKCF